MSERGAQSTRQSTRPLRVGLFGGPLDTGNLGVSALGISTVHGLHKTGIPLECTLFDHGRGERATVLEADSWSARVVQVGCTYSRRYYRTDNLPQMLLAARAGLARIHPMLARLLHLDAILDLSGGDSFSDLYGQWRFRLVTAPKKLTLRLGLPLVLLPQTYGPFQSDANREVARAIARVARQCWARDERSLDLLRRLLGDDFDAERQSGGVDVAFGLPVRKPGDPALVARVRAMRQGAGSLLGLNVSGLLYNVPGDDRTRFGLRMPYRELMREIVMRLLQRDSTRILLVPHVVAPCKSIEADRTACHALQQTLDPVYRERVVPVPDLRDPMEVKWVIGQCDWFCGTRMHACIAALSQGIPTLGLAYSDKSLGVFETAGAGAWVADPRALDLGQVLERIESSLAHRDSVKRVLERARPRIEARLTHQFRSILESVRQTGNAAVPGLVGCS